MIAGEEHAARVPAGPRDAIEPRDHERMFLLERLAQREEFLERGEAHGALADPWPRHALQANLGPRDEAREAEPADGGAIELGVFLRAAQAARSVGTQQLESRHVVAKRAGAMVVLAMDVVGDGAAEGHVFRARRDGQEEAARQGEIDDLGEQHARLAAQDSARRVERDEVVEVARTQERPAVVEARVAIAAALAVRQQRATVGRQRQGGPAIAHALDALPRREDAAPRAVVEHLVHVASITTATAAAAAR